MMANHIRDEQESFIIPSRTLRGSRQEMVQDIDQAVIGLLALRHLIDDGAPPPEAIELAGGQRPRQNRSRWPRFFTGLPLAGERR